MCQYSRERFFCYVLVCTIDWKQNISSSYGKERIFRRWETYANTYDLGGKGEGSANKALAEHLSKNPNCFHHLQYCILEVIHRTGDADNDMRIAVEHETLWKQKIGTKGSLQGLNLNSSTDSHRVKNIAPLKDLFSDFI